MSLYYLAAVARNPRIKIPVLFILACITGCAGTPAFRIALPETIDTSGKSIAIIGDLQQTSAFVRFVRHREDNSIEQQRLIGDLHENIDELSALVIVGDLVYSARSAKDWVHFDSLVEEFAQRMPILPAIGNHDYPCYLVQFCRSASMARGMAARFPWMMPGQPYSVTAGRLLLLFLDSESQLEAQARWLAAQLLSAPPRHTAALVFLHRPAYTNSIDRGARGSAAVQRFVVPSLQNAALPVAVFSGHIHGYEHIVSDGMQFITTAGGGGPRGPMTPERNPDAYRGPNCIDDRGAVLRPFNYILLSESQTQIDLEVRGFCRGDAEIRVLEKFTIPL